MVVLTSFYNKCKSIVRNYFENLAETKFPNRFKRLIYISSVLAVIKQIKEPDQFLVDKLNSIFNIAKYSDAIFFPMYIKSFIWENILTSNVIEINGKSLFITEIASTGHNPYSDEECVAMASYFSKLAPKWLRYGSENLMVHDVTTLFQHLDEFHNENSRLLLPS